MRLRLFGKVQRPFLSAARQYHQANRQSSDQRQQQHKAKASCHLVYPADLIFHSVISKPVPSSSSGGANLHWGSTTNMVARANRALESQDRIDVLINLTAAIAQLGQ